MRISEHRKLDRITLWYAAATIVVLSILGAAATANACDDPCPGSGDWCHCHANREPPQSLWDQILDGLYGFVESLDVYPDVMWMWRK